MKTKTKTNGTLFGIGVGPGDPELIPIKATRLLGAGIDRVFTAASTRNKYSLAVEIARDHIPTKTPIEKMDFPMSSDQSVKELAWEKNAARILSVLETGENVAFLTLGDPLTYSTYGYTIRHLKNLSPDVKIVTIPGITSYQAAAARTNTPLVEGQESLLVMSGVESNNNSKSLPLGSDNVVFLKAYRDIKGIYASLDKAGLAESSVGIINCGRPNEAVYDDIRDLLNLPPNYWTLIIAKRKKEHGSEEA